MIKREIRIFFTALMFYTRIPCPKWVGHEPEYINLSVRYFPLIGWLVGFGAFAAYYLTTFCLNSWVGVIISSIVTVLMTGAFHEDGFADVCDGFGGGWTKEKILMIMKDSRVGAYGVVGLICLFALKFALLISLSEELDMLWIFITWIVAHTLSRFSASVFIFTDSYVQDTDVSKAKPVANQVSMKNLWLASIFSVVPLLFLIIYSHQWPFLIIFAALTLVFLYLRRYYNKWIGGYTGDCLGAAQQIFEVIIYMSILGVWKFI
ncbi:adenosylcobinamide-GDP ribazoletransferase [Fulvivirga ligni]|uniref:adenosylcobinamide-GDP ribazoletransferase n=1 Tax=Fulvivirga ligni TaxID=2904246 RepID=UPI001F4736AC|nr:adenosylcobinamide-GDP ribazoletransferase [Fulvivirga ligni]UII24047.1 adenosylcobinamide-GDP ribazoletransferase [Fulvivirga ligni]